jgi:TorA maturation chaperone TorD
MDAMRMKKARSVEALMQGAALFRALALGCAYPETGHRDALLQALNALPRNHNGFPGTALCNALKEAGDAMLAEEYTRVFLGNGPCSLHETAYGDGRRMAGRPSELADIGGFYAAFGVELAARSPDLPDLLPTELEFYSLLLVKQAYALSRNWPEQRSIAARAAREFMEHHLGRWSGAFAESMLEHCLLPAYRELARAVRAEVDAECRELGVQPTLASGRMPFDVMQAEDFNCPHETQADSAGSATD